MIPVNRSDINNKDVMAFVKGHFKDVIPVVEKEFSQYIGAEHALFTSSCRSSLYLTYKALKLEGEVITQPLTCSIAILPLICCGLKPHFVDIDPQTYNINPEKLNESITNDTRAVQLIHLAGNPCDMKAIKEIVEDHNLILIEDCAQSLGAEYYQNKIGSFGDISCFSFTKNVYGIGGGMILTNNENIILRAKRIQQKFHKFPPLLGYYRLIRNIAEKNMDDFWENLRYGLLLWLRDKMMSHEAGHCDFLESTLYQPTNVESAIVQSQIEKLDTLLQKRIRNALLMSRELKGKGIKIQTITQNSKHVFTKYMVETKCKSMDVIKKLHEKGIDAKHLEYKHGIAYQERFDIDPYYARFNSIKKCKNYLNIHDHIVSLPISSNMDRAEILMIARAAGDSVENV
jgi:perosamine synthetase